MFDDQSDLEFKKEILQKAIEYGEHGWRVFPTWSIDKNGQCSCGKTTCGKDSGKHPATPRGLNEATKDIDKIKDAFAVTGKLFNIGVVCGEASGITVLDVDAGFGKFGPETWSALCEEHGEPQTLMAITGGGGFHVVFKYNSSLKTSSNTLGKNVDCRNDGGYFLAAPSRHLSGNKYKWENELPLADLPSHLSKRKETRGRKRKDDMYRGKYSIEQVKTMLEHVPSDDRDTWRNVGIILGREFNRIDEAWSVYLEWANKAGGKKGRNHDSIQNEAFYKLSQEHSDKELTLGTIVKLAIDGGWSPKAGEVPIGNFVFYGPGNNFIYRPTISYWQAGAVDAATSPVNENGRIWKASDWLQRNQLVTSMTTDPAIEDDYVKGFDCRNGEVVASAGAALFNSYRKPTIELGDARLAGPGIAHAKNIFNKPGDADQVLDYMAHRVQKPWEKPRFALMLAGGMGIGKDTIIEFCVPAIGAWNVANIEPQAFEGAFNEYADSSLVRISEAANLIEMSKWAFNERTKVLIAGTPDYVSVNPKYGQKYSLRMYCGVIITTNHLASGIYIPPGDRRYDVIECATMEEMGIEKEDKRKEYFTDLWDWFHAGGANHMAAYLHERDISKFSPNNGQRKTAAHSIVIAGGMTGDQWLDDILEEMKYPIGVRADWIVTKAVSAGEKDMEIRRRLANSIGRLGYVFFKNPAMADGRWKIGAKKVTVYVKAGTPVTFNPESALSSEPF